MMKDSCDFHAFIAERIEDNIVQINLKRVKKLTSEDVAQMYKCIRECNGLKGVYVIVTFSGYIPPSDEAQREAKKPENEKYVKGMAYVIQNSGLRVMAKFFMNFYRPNYSSGIFSTKAQALNWLKKLRKESAR